MLTAMLGEGPICEELPYGKSAPLPPHPTVLPPFMPPITLTLICCLPISLEEYSYRSLKYKRVNETMQPLEYELASLPQQLSGMK